MKTFIVALSLFALPNSLRAEADDAIPEPAQRIDVRYRLFRTMNFYNFLLLDTRTGWVEQIQWDTERKNRLTTTINFTTLADTDRDGRFTLYPTKNIYTFLLVDQEDGRVWQVQWGTKAENRFIVPINPRITDNNINDAITK